MTEYSKYSEVSPQWAKFVSEAPELQDLDKVGIVERKRIFIELEGKVPARILPHDATDQNVSVRTFTIATRDGYDLPVRSYVPLGQKVTTTRPVLVYLHAGGFLFGDLESGDLNCRVLAARLGISVLNVGYRLAPEWPFPCGVNDAYDATEWVSGSFARLAYNYALTMNVEVAVNAKEILNASPEQGFLVGGISSGANFAGVIAYTARDAGLTPPITEWLNQLLSLEQNAENPLLTRKSLTDIQELYGCPPGDPRISFLLNKDHSNLPPRVYFQICGRDPARDEAFLWSKLLSQHSRTMEASQGWLDDLVEGIGFLLRVDEDVEGNHITVKCA